MVNSGASRGCITCKKRRVKCDEAKPACKECDRLGRECAGYGKQPLRVRFRDEAARYLNRTPHHAKATNTADCGDPKKTRSSSRAHHQLCRSRSHVTIPEDPSCKQQDFAVAFFLKYVTDVGRHLETTRGFLEFVRPVLAAEASESALTAAVNATAMKLWALLRPSDVTASLLIQLHHKALVRLQKAVYSPVEREKDSTVFAAIMLQHNDTLTAVFDHHKAHSTHREGAVALLRQNGQNNRSPRYHGHLLGNLLHSKISFCVRHRVPLTASESAWLQSEAIPALPSNPSFLLDVIGISISKLQTVLRNSISQQEDVALGALQELPAIILEIDAQLSAWLDTVPEFWRPLMIQGETCLLPSATTFHGSCDVYPSVQIANIWNTWRIYRLIVELAKITPLHDSPSTVDASAQHLEVVQGLVEAICRSMPFYLGNCSQPASFSDMDNPLLIFPSYHNLPPAHEAFVEYRNSDHYVSRTDHRRQVLLHGSLHALSVLSSLIGILFEESTSVSAQSIPYREQQWINEQFHRSLHLMRFEPHLMHKDDSQHLTPPDQVHQESSPAALAQVIRQALGTVTVL